MLLEETLLGASMTIIVFVGVVVGGGGVVVVVMVMVWWCCGPACQRILCVERSFVWDEISSGS